jgi:hypothetical protein
VIADFSAPPFRLRRIGNHAVSFFFEKDSYA